MKAKVSINKDWNFYYKEAIKLTEEVDKYMLTDGYSVNSRGKTVEQTICKPVSRLVYLVSDKPKDARKLVKDITLPEYLSCDFVTEVWLDQNELAELQYFIKVIIPAIK